MTTVVMKQPTYTATQWIGTNAQELADTVAAYAQIDATWALNPDGSLTIRYGTFGGCTVPPDGHVLIGPTWGSGAPQGMEVLTHTDFTNKYQVP